MGRWAQAQRRGGGGQAPAAAGLAAPIPDVDFQFDSFSDTMVILSITTGPATVADGIVVEYASDPEGPFFPFGTCFYLDMVGPIGCVEGLTYYFRVAWSLIGTAVSPFSAPLLPGVCVL